MSIPIQTNVTNKCNTNVSSKQIDGRVTKTGREKKRRMERVAREGRDQLAPSILYVLSFLVNHQRVHAHLSERLRSQKRFYPPPSPHGLVGVVAVVWNRRKKREMAEG